LLWEISYCFEPFTCQISCFPRKPKSIVNVFLKIYNEHVNVTNQV